VNQTKGYDLKKITGLYFCSGCEIGKQLDLRELTNHTDLSFAKVCRVHSALCSEEGYDQIKKDIESENLDSIIIAACSPREKTNSFAFPDSIQVERVNLREQVILAIDTEKDEKQIAAEDYLRMSIAKLQNSTRPVPFIPEKVSDQILVVGAGITGISAALEGAKAGYTIHLVEKEESLGGWSAKQYKQVPLTPPFASLNEPLIHAWIAEAEANNNIIIHKSAYIEKISGQPGNFEINLHNRKSEKILAGAIVAAMGWKPYDSNKLSFLGYGKYKNVVTNIEFEERIKSNQQLPQDILFIQCAGSRDKEHLPYCSTYCCTTSLKHAKYIREKSPVSSVYIIYKDIRIPGVLENFYQEIQSDDQVFFTKGEVQRVFEKDGKLRVEVHNTFLGDDIMLTVDMVVLATGMIPSGTTDLNLTYRQGKGLPELKYDFSDSHFICFPYETRRTGIYAAGTLRMPMDIESCVEDASGAMLKAIQCIEATKRGEAVHPRSGDRSCPELFMDRCTDCKRCTEECPFGMYDETEKGTPLSNPTRCRRCGICLGSCPERVINFADYSIHGISAMIKAVTIPDESEGKFRILAFVCENDAYPAFDIAARKGLTWSSALRIIPVRCLGSINKVWISDALSCGYDGILQIGCKPGDDYQCHFIHGSELTKVRGENIQETLHTMMLEPERIRTEFIEITDYQKIPEIISEYCEIIRQIGPNPFKSM
jgi:quinone-modifying oxidoreductase subunit QmoB